MRAPSSDKVLLGAAFALLLLSAGAFALLTTKHPRARPGSIPPVQLADAAYTPIAPDAPPVKVETWAPPPAQTRGRDWIYDTFTPPEIFYNSRSKQFTVKPPSGLGDEEPTEAFGVELVSVRPEPFRLQLIGFAGEDAGGKGIFQNLLSGEVFLAAAGRRVPNLALSIKKLDVARQAVLLPESTTTRQRVATAIIHDERANRDVTLTHRDRVFTGMLFAMVAPTGETSTREVREGDSFKIGEASYRIDKIQTTPPTVEITKESPQLTQPDHRTLTPREVEGAETPEPDAR
jgi:hypothetical protein